MTSQDKLDVLLAQHFGDHAGGAADAGDRESADRVLAALAHPLPLQRRSWRLWPAALLDWDFAPAWPRVAMLASCAVLGFAVGVASPILRGGDAPATTRDLGTAISEPEPMTGVLP